MTFEIWDCTEKKANAFLPRVAKYLRDGTKNKVIIGRSENCCWKRCMGRTEIAVTNWKKAMAKYLGNYERF